MNFLSIIANSDSLSSQNGLNDKLADIMLPPLQVLQPRHKCSKCNSWKSLAVKFALYSVLFLFVIDLKVFMTKSEIMFLFSGEFFLGALSPRKLV